MGLCVSAVSPTSKCCCGREPWVSTVSPALGSVFSIELALIQHLVDERMNEGMGEWLVFLWLFSCVCLPASLILEQIPENSGWVEGEVPLHPPRAFTRGPGPVFRGLPGLLSTCLSRPDRATPCPQSPQKWGQVPAGPHLSEASAESGR